MVWLRGHSRAGVMPPLGELAASVTWRWRRQPRQVVSPRHRKGSIGGGVRGSSDAVSLHEEGMGYRAELWVQGRSPALELFSRKQIRHLPLHTSVALGPPFWVTGNGADMSHPPAWLLPASRLRY